MVKDTVIPGIFENMWWHHRDSGKPEAGTEIFVQYDGASPHTSAYAARRIRYWESDVFFNRHGFRLKFVQQPAQSPDLNICDLTFWHSNKCTLKGKVWKSKREMMNDVQAAWLSYSREKLEAGWQALFTIFRGILRSGGNNNFSRHEGARRRRRAGLGTDYSCPQDIFDYGSAERDRLEGLLGLTHNDHESDSDRSCTSELESDDN